jgi:hypothetical protein
MDLAKTRSFLLGAYHDLPNVLLVGSLLFGSIAGYRPLLWVALGLIGNVPITYLCQFLTKQIATNVPSAASYVRVQHRGRCAIITDPTISDAPGVLDSYVPSWWTTSAFFFVAFTCWNGLAILFGDNPNATMDQKNNRRAYALSVIVISCIIAFMTLSRTFDGCETVWGVAIGAVVGIGWGIGYWHLLDVCHSGITPDVLQIIGNSAPASSGVVTPIVCA